MANTISVIITKIIRIVDADFVAIVVASLTYTYVINNYEAYFIADRMNLRITKKKYINKIVFVFLKLTSKVGIGLLVEIAAGGYTHFFVLGFLILPN